MEVEEPVKCGSLYVPAQGFLKQKKSWNKRYYVLYRSSRQGIQRLEVFDSEEQYLKQHNCHRIIALTDCLKVAPTPQKQQSNVFEIRTKDNTYLFSSDTFHEMTEWLQCLQTVAFANYTPNTVIPQNVNFSIDSNANHFNSSNTSNNLSEAQSEENLLYSSVGSPDVYRVKLIDSETSIRCGLTNHFDLNYTLIVTAVNISLAEEGKVLFIWPYRHIRRYGCTKDGFSLEAGRKCASGEGLFSFITKDGNSIFQSVATHVNSLKASRSINDDQISGFNLMGANNMSPKVNTKNIYFTQNVNNESKPSLPSTSPPLSSSYSSKSNYFATNSSLLPSTKISESTKRFSIQPPKSPQMIPKQALTRVTSNSIIATSEPKPKPSPPISKPPRKSKESKESKTSDVDEPVFVSREEILGLNSVTNNTDFSGTYKTFNDEILYDEPGDPSTHSDDSKPEQNNKSPFCPSPPPVNQTVNRLTSVLKMMFSGNVQNPVQPKYKNRNCVVSARSSTGSSGNASNISSPTRTTAPEKLDSDGLAYSRVSVIGISKTDKNNIKSDVTYSDDSDHYSKVLNDKSNSTDSLTSDCFEHQYANVVHNSSDDFNKITDNSNENKSQTEHYVQNDCEYALVVKRTINNTSL